MLEIHSFFNDTKDFFARGDNRFQILEEYFLNVSCYSQHNGYRHSTHLSLIFIINFFATIFLKSRQYNKSSHDL